MSYVCAKWTHHAVTIRCNLHHNNYTFIDKNTKLLMYYVLLRYYSKYNYNIYLLFIYTSALLCCSFWETQFYTYHIYGDLFGFMLYCTFWFSQTNIYVCSSGMTWIAVSFLLHSFSNTLHSTKHFSLLLIPWYILLVSASLGLLCQILYKFFLVPTYTACPCDINDCRKSQLLMYHCTRLPDVGYFKKQHSFVLRITLMLACPRRSHHVKIRFIY